ncbi:hypothetical protein BABINDRAFT_159213 [Babjeviella inositovora NRRL Y-12698]|uniref:Cytochrome c oxidase-assembly factor COX23, mitochondrial n=1 Tax=Babjeviella inositovora NRRL Y-12698 TaxID=984486 RepID=A0A1E3QYE6_9ASCO|nr:uncharacterized protein BABINDRAFT_159213 [Babjeviella inositovora NRRL Y-12698]ODQ82683.1 hypothetical protein BABINDRAFT_159213 [Babjeviella inositovora NRRL Y-12698]
MSTKTPIEAQDPSLETQKEKVEFVTQEKIKMYPDNPTTNHHQRQMMAKEPSKFYDPCHETAQMSLRCLDRNDYNKEMCHEYFAAYRECKKEWMEQRRADRSKGNWW